MNLVVAGKLITRRIKEQARCTHPLIVSSHNGDRTSCNPYVPRCGLPGKKILYGAMALPFPDPDLIVFGFTHDGKILRQHDKPRTLIHRPADQSVSLFQIGAHLRTGGHLYGRNPIHGPSSMGAIRCPCSLISSAPFSFSWIRLTTGLSHGPVMLYFTCVALSIPDSSNRCARRMAAPTPIPPTTAPATGRLDVIWGITVTSWS